MRNTQDVFDISLFGAYNSAGSKEEQASDWQLPVILAASN